jgi:hypothetical protein
VRGNGYGSGHWLRHLLAGSPLLQTESGSLSFGTTGLPRAAPHLVSRRRSCLRLLSRCSSRDDSDFHWLISYMCVRTSTARLACVLRSAHWFLWAGCEQEDQFPNGRDGRPPFFCAAKSNFKVTMVSVPHLHIFLIFLHSSPCLPLTHKSIPTFFSAHLHPAARAIRTYPKNTNTARHTLAGGVLKRNVD